MRATLAKNPADVEAMFDDVAARYDLTNSVITAGQDTYWRWRTARTIKAGPGDLVLDVAAGTGRSAEPLLRAGADVVACDLSGEMLQVARDRVPGLRTVQGSATALPFEDDVFDVVTISFGLRNVDRPHIALAEMLRVTKPGGKLVVCEFSMPDDPLVALAHDAYMTRIIPTLVKMVTPACDAYDYLAESILGWHSKEELSATIAEQGWDDVRFAQVTSGIVAIHSGVKPA